MRYCVGEILNEKNVHWLVCSELELCFNTWGGISISRNPRFFELPKNSKNKSYFPLICFSWTQKFHLWIFELLIAWNCCKLEPILTPLEKKLLNFPEEVCACHKKKRFSSVARGCVCVVVYRLYMIDLCYFLDYILFCVGFCISAWEF